MQQEIAYPYIETRITPSPVILLDQIKSYLKLNTHNNVVDEELTLMCNVALSYAEKYTRQYFSIYKVTTSRCFWGEFRNGFLQEKFTLRRAPLISVEKISYNGNELSEENYKVINNFGQYGEIYLRGELPEIDEDLFPIQIEFKAGRSTLPPDIKIAMLQHIASMWMNRGDCDNDVYNKCPKISKEIYKKYKIIEVGA